MEGLIPMVYKAIKKNRTRRQYECLSSGAAQSYNISDFYPVNDDAYSHLYITPSTEKNTKAERGSHHRRYNSVGNFSSRFSPVDDAGIKGRPSPRPKQLVRFRTHRMFSCVTGA